MSACCITPAEYRGRDSNSQQLVPKTSASADWATPARLANPAGLEPATSWFEARRSGPTELRVRSGDGETRTHKRRGRYTGSGRAPDPAGSSPETESNNGKPAPASVRNTLGKRKGWDSNPQRIGYRHTFSKRAPDPAGSFPKRRRQELNLHGTDAREFSKLVRLPVSPRLRGGGATNRTPSAGFGGQLVTMTLTPECRREDSNLRSPEGHLVYSQEQLPLCDAGDLGGINCQRTKNSLGPSLLIPVRACCGFREREDRSREVI